MAIPESGSELPNLKIEIENDLDEAMETDDNDITEDKASKEEGPEEGELSDSKDTETEVKVPTFGHSMSTPSEPVWEREKRYENKGGAFVTGVDIFAKEEQSKLDERAKRFGLDPADAKAVTEQQIIDLYKSLGIKDEEGNEKHFRLNTLHMRGTENMSTQDIFNYFKDYGPASIEWINDYSCNVVWLDDATAARAMIGLSKHINGLEEFHSKADPFLKDEEKEKESDKENEKEEIVYVHEIEKPDGEDIVMVVGRGIAGCPEIEKIEELEDDSEMNLDNDTVHASEITIPIPPGKWRMGTSHPKAKCILLRFSTRSDRKLPQAEKLSAYYKKYGNPNYGGIRGLITTSRKRRYQRNEHRTKIFDDDQGDERDFNEVPGDGKNPWGNLAKTWSKLDKSKNSRKTESYDVVNSPRAKSPSSEESPDERQGRSVLHRNPVSESDSEDTSSSSESDEESVWTKRSKVPRMRMYADEEEHRIERRRAQVQAHSKRKARRDYHEKHSRSENQRRRSSSAHGKHSRTETRKRDSSEHKSRKNETFRDNVSRKHDDLRSRLEKDGKNKSRGSVSVVTSTVWDRLKSYHVDETVDSEQDSTDSDSEENADLRGTVLQGKKSISRFEGGDLRSKLNLKKTMKQHIPVQKSPLRIEIDNDEYYRLIGSDQE